MAKLKRARSRVFSASWSLPDISDSERGFLPDKLTLVPRLMAVW
jgi:hypothetical protein